jgi:hypothetical protein
MRGYSERAQNKALGGPDRIKGSVIGFAADSRPECIRIGIVPEILLV